MRKMATWEEKRQKIQNYWNFLESCKTCLFGEEQNYIHPDRCDFSPYKSSVISLEDNFISVTDEQAQLHSAWSLGLCT